MQLHAFPFDKKALSPRSQLKNESYAKEKSVNSLLIKSTSVTLKRLDQSSQNAILTQSVSFAGEYSLKNKRDRKNPLAQ